MPLAPAHSHSESSLKRGSASTLTYRFSCLPCTFPPSPIGILCTLTNPTHHTSFRGGITTSSTPPQKTPSRARCCSSSEVGQRMSSSSGYQDSGSAFLRSNPLPSRYYRRAECYKLLNQYGKGMPQYEKIETLFVSRPTSVLALEVPSHRERCLASLTQRGCGVALLRTQSTFLESHGGEYCTGSTTGSDAKITLSPMLTDGFTVCVQVLLAP